jgi:hypothetical protein
MQPKSVDEIKNVIPRTATPDEKPVPHNEVLDTKKVFTIVMIH